MTRATAFSFLLLATAAAAGATGQPQSATTAPARKPVFPDTVLYGVAYYHEESLALHYGAPRLI